MKQRLPTPKSRLLKWATKTKKEKTPEKGKAAKEQIAAGGSPVQRADPPLPKRKLTCPVCKISIGSAEELVTHFRAHAQETKETPELLLERSNKVLRSARQQLLRSRGQLPPAPLDTSPIKPQAVVLS
jgi:hypothetical protein